MSCPLALTGAPYADFFVDAKRQSGHSSDRAFPGDSTFSRQTRKTSNTRPFGELTYGLTERSSDRRGALLEPSFSFDTLTSLPDAGSDLNLVLAWKFSKEMNPKLSFHSISKLFNGPLPRKVNSSNNTHRGSA